ncbi:MAG: ATP-binding protein [Candidatus Obscuribacterales bacterium]|nr:ATP-binding protein [Steroidobacteraceae bacterium]
MSKSTAASLPTEVAIRDTLGHLSLELKRFDQIIRRRVYLFRREAQASDAIARAAPTYVSDQEADALLNTEHSRFQGDNHCAQLDARIAALEQTLSKAIAACEREGVLLPLPRLVQLFGLSWLEVQALIVCLAPELRRKYDRLYAYLQDDITRRRPSLDLILDLFVDDETQRWQARTLLDPHSALFRHRLIDMQEDTESLSGSTGLATFLRIDSRILQYLLGNNVPAVSLTNLLKVVPPQATSSSSEQASSLIQIIESAVDGTNFSRRLLLNVHGTDAATQRDTVMAACNHLHCSLLLVDGAALLAGYQHSESLLRLLGRESLLMQAPLFIENLDDWFADTASARQALKALLEILSEYCWLGFTGAAQAWPAQRLPQDVALFNIELAPPNAAQRERLWEQALQTHALPTPPETVRSLAADYRLSSAQIRAAAMQIQAQSADSTSLPAWPVLSGACRSVSHQGLRELGVRVPAKYQWDDLILPEPVKAQLYDIRRQVSHRRRVFDDWGFGDKLSYGRALSVLFSGSPGTGKTMAAQVLAAELQLDLFKIDLSGVVSKYIGETEKNLNRVFTEAQTGNAILFFDEADALFGKRTEVADAHDRYANIEVSYLLQKMEEYDGIVILATNFRNNMDDAFVRRIRFIVDFPFPDEAGRAEIWRHAIPQQTPLDADVDFDWLAAKIKIAGGSIKNVVLNAAFGAAHEASSLGMSQLLQSCRYEFQKIGKLWDEKSLGYSGGHRTRPMQSDSTLKSTE